MKRVYGEFCSRHNEAVSFFKELQQQNKKFQLFIKVSMFLCDPYVMFHNPKKVGLTFSLLSDISLLIFVE